MQYSIFYLNIAFSFFVVIHYVGVLLYVCKKSSRVNIEAKKRIVLVDEEILFPVYLSDDLLWQFSTSLPKYTSTVAQRNLKNFCQVFWNLSLTFILDLGLL